MSEDTKICRRCVKEWKQSSSSRIHFTNIKCKLEPSTPLPVDFVYNLWFLADSYSIHCVHLCLMSDCPYWCPFWGSVFIEQHRKHGEEISTLQKSSSEFYMGLSRWLQLIPTDPDNKHHCLSTNIHKRFTQLLWWILGRCFQPLSLQLYALSGSGSWKST